jgi:hypothetical protein
MATYSFYEFSNYKKRSDVFAFLDSYSGTINESVLQELYTNFGYDDVVNEAWGDWLNKAKGMAQNVAAGAANVVAGAVKGAKDFGQGFAQGSQQGYKDTRTEEGVKKIENIAAKVGELSKAFTQKYKIDPVTAAIIISSGATGGLGAIPMTALAIGLRKGSAWLAGKGMDAAWKKATGKTPAELDQMWQSKINAPKAAPAAAGAKPATPPPVPAAGAKPAAPAPAPAGARPAGARPATPPPVPVAAGARPAAKPTAPSSDQFHYEMFKRPKTSFATFLENKDADLYKNIIDEGMWDNAKGFLTGALNKGADIAKGYAKDIGDQGFAKATGSLVGKGAGQAAGTFVNLGSVLGSSLKNAASFMANNPVKTGTMMMAIAAGSMIGSYGTQAINGFINKPSPDQVQELTAVAKQAGVPDSEIQSMHQDSGYSGSGGDFGDANDTASSGTGGDFGAKDTSYSGSGGDFGGGKNIPDKRWIDSDGIEDSSTTAPGAGEYLPKNAQDTSYSGTGGDFDTSSSGTGGDFSAKDTSYSGTGGDFGGSKNIPDKRWIDSGDDTTGGGEFIPSKDTQTYYANKDTNYKTMPTVGSPEDIAMKKSFLPNSDNPDFITTPPEADDFIPKDRSYTGNYNQTPKVGKAGDAWAAAERAKDAARRSYFGN